MQLIIKSDLYSKVNDRIVIEQEEQQQGNEVGDNLNPELVAYIKDIVNPPSKVESEKINDVVGLVSQQPSEQPAEDVGNEGEGGEEGLEEEDVEDNYIPIKQTELIKKLVSLKSELTRNEKNIKDNTEFNDILYTIDGLIENFEIYTYEDQLDLIELVIKKMNKIN